MLSHIKRDSIYYTKLHPITFYVLMIETILIIIVLLII